MKTSTSFWRKFMSRTRFFVVMGLVLFVVGISIAIAGPFGFFGRSTGGCANGSCNSSEFESKPVSTPIIVPVPAPVNNNILELPTKKRNPKNYSDSKNLINQTPSNNILDICDCKNCTCVKCVCENCKCDNCPGKKIELLTTETVEVPSLLGKTYWEAKAERGEFTIDGDSYSDTDVVVSQIPAAGQLANKGTSIKLIFQEVGIVKTEKFEQNIIVTEKKAEYNQQPQVQTEYYERPRLLRRIFGRR